MNKTISLPEELVKEIETMTRANGQTFSGVVRVCLERYVKNGTDEIGQLQS